MAVLGSTVDPRLGAVSPAAIQALSQAGAATGQMYSNLGSSIAGVIQDQAQRKTDAGIAQIIAESTVDEFDEEGNRTGFRTLDQSKFRKLVSDRKLPPAQANAILQDTLDAWKTEAELIAAQRKIDLDNQTDNRRIDATKRGQDISREMTLAGLSAQKERQEDELSSLERRLGMSLTSQEGIASDRIASEEKMTRAKLDSAAELNASDNSLTKYLGEMNDATKRELGLTGLKDAMTIAEMNIGSEMEMLDRRLENATASDKRQIRFEKKRLNKTLAQNQKQFKQEIKLSRKELKQEGDLFREKLSLDRDLANQRN